MNALNSLLYREILRFVRQRSRWIGALATPLLFWLLVGTGLGSAFQDPGSGRVGYLEFFFPGAVLLSVLFTAIFSTISVIEDRDKGFLQGVLVSPQSSSVLVWSKVLAGAILGTLQGVLLMALLFVLPFKAPLMGVLLGVVLLFIMSLCLTAVAFFFAWKSSSVSGFHGVMNMILMPMWIMSGSVFPVLGSDSILAKLALFNPLTWGLSSFKMLVGGQPIGIVDLAMGFGYPLIVTLVFWTLANRSISARRGA
ncbi:MAG TPA: ABC transporter permease [Bdellovibrionota bacterium]|jgi:ABC-2 type transport system permease protein|nr:ABC transporter permease [Bdellovibrionota bacterium]